jgi:hypothetical protein
VFAPAGSFVVAVIACPEAPESIVCAPVGEEMPTVIALTAILTVAVAE